jgi:PAS domain-containing protein
MEMAEYRGKPFDAIWPQAYTGGLTETFVTACKEQRVVILNDVHYKDQRLEGDFKISAYPLAPRTLAVTFEEIGAFKRMQHSLEESMINYRMLYKLLSEAESIAHIGSWSWDVRTDTVMWSNELFRIFGRNPIDGAPKYSEHSKLYTPKSMTRLDDAVNKALTEGVPYEIRLTARATDSSLRECIARGTVERNDEGDVVRLYGSLQYLKDVVEDQIPED